MGYDNNECYKRLESTGNTPVCDKISTNMSHHCSSFMVTDTYHTTCVNKDVYMPVQTWYCMNSRTGEVRYFDPKVIMKECMKLSKIDDAWECQPCFCCCACFAEHTMIAMAEGTKEIKNIKKGEILKAGSIMGPGESLCTWEDIPVTFAEGSESGVQEGMLYVVFGDKQEIIVTPDHVFLLATGKFIQAGKLKPGDQLVDESGNPIPILTVSQGRYEGGVRHISCNIDFDGRPDRHLVLSEGIVSGDYTLQLYYDALSEEWKEKGHEKRLLVGSHDFFKEYQDQMKGNITFFAENATDTAGPDCFQAYDLQGLRENVNYQYAKKFLTSEQAADIFNESTMSPLSDGIKHGYAQYAVQLLRGFFPDIEILLDWKHLSPNVYSFVLFDKKFVVLSGGLARVQGIGVEGLVFAVSQGIARFYGENGICHDKMSSRGKADFYAAAAISRNVYYSRIWGDVAKETIKEIETLFSYIRQEHAESSPSIDCRLDAIYSGFGGGNLPACAGGKEYPDLSLQLAEAKPQQVDLIFNLELNQEIALEKEHYQILGADVKEVQVDEKEPFRVSLKTELAEGSSHLLKLDGLVSVYGTELDVESREKKITVK